MSSMGSLGPIYTLIPVIGMLMIYFRLLSQHIPMRLHVILYPMHTLLSGLFEDWECITMHLMRSLQMVILRAGSRRDNLPRSYNSRDYNYCEMCTLDETPNSIC